MCATDDQIMDKLRIYITCLFLLSLLIFFSCSGGSRPQDKTVTDTVPPDIAAISKQIEADPANADLYIQRAVLYIEKKQPQDALGDVNKAIGINSAVPKYYRTLADVYFSLGKSQQCSDALNKALDIDPADTSAYLKFAEMEYYFKAYEKAFSYANKALEIDARNAKAFFIKGMAYKDMGDTAKAVKNLQKAVEYDQQYYHAYMQLGLLYSAKHNALAADYLNNALKCNPKSIETYYALGMFYQENELYNQAIEAYSALLKIDPKYKYAYYNLGYIHLVYLQVYDVAARHFSEAIKVDPEYAEAWYNRGYCYELLGDVMNAKTNYQRAVSIRPNYQRAVDGLNRIDAIIKH
jgi:tetratricopeptide (TPR) repeat protein